MQLDGIQERRNTVTIRERSYIIQTNKKAPTSANSTLYNNTKYCEMTATIRKDENEIQQVGPLSPWEKLLQRQPKWVRTLARIVDYV